MKVAIMQPYFFPYVGYFSLLQATEKFVIFDIPQYDRKGWMNRNRILNLNGSDTFINLPTYKMPLGTTIKDIQINNDIDWKNKILKQLAIYKKAPYYVETIEVIEKIFSLEINRLVEFNAISMKYIAEYLNINCEIQIFSEMGLTIEEVNAPDEWALNICKAMEATQYFNPPGGMTFFDNKKYEAANINLYFLKHHLPQYKQFHLEFIAGLSIIDVMMFNDKDSINKMLCEYDIL